MMRWLTSHRVALDAMLVRVLREPLSIALNVIAVAIVLALPLLGLVLVASFEPVSGRLASDPEISVFLSLDAKRADALALGVQLRGLAGVAEARFVPRENAVEELRQRPGMQAALAALHDNPLPDAWILRLSREAADAQGAVSLQESMARRISKLPSVEHVQIDSAWAARMESLLHLLRLAVALVGLALALAVIAAVFNTIRLQVASQHAEIEVARLIGATDAFICRPFYYTGALQGFAGGVLALLVVWVVLIPLNTEVAALAHLYSAEFGLDMPAAGQILLFLAVSAMLGWIGAALSVRSQLARKA